MTAPRYSLALIYSRAARQANGCRLWTGPRSTAGYGRLGDGYAHRAALEAKLGRPLRPGMESCHSDACATHGRRGRLCVEPSHLCEAPRSSNAEDRERVERARRGRGAVLGARRL